jgi:hypothetical protein
MNEMISNIQVLHQGRRSIAHAITQAVNYATDVLQAVSNLTVGFPDIANRSWVDAQSDDVKNVIMIVMEAEDTANQVMTLSTEFRGDTGENREERREELDESGESERVRAELSDRKGRISDTFNSAYAEGSTLYNDKKHMKDIYDAFVEFNTDIVTKYARYGIDDLAFSPKDIANAHIRYLIAGTPLTKDAIEIMRGVEGEIDQLKRDGKNDEATSLSRRLVKYADKVMTTLATVHRDVTEVREGGEFHKWYNDIYTFAQTVIERFDPDGTLGRPKREEDRRPEREEDRRPIREQLPYDTWRVDFIQPVIDGFRTLISGRLTSRSKQVPSRDKIGTKLILATNSIIRSKQLELTQLTKASSNLQKVNVDGKPYLYFIEAVVKAQTSADLTDKVVIDTMKLREFFEKVDTSLGLSGDESRLIGRFVEKLYG